jgi:hypothetical protein
MSFSSIPSTMKVRRIIFIWQSLSLLQFVLNRVHICDRVPTKNTFQLLYKLYRV